MKLPKLIWDNGTPGCLPRWACDEIMTLRIANSDLRDRVLKLRLAGARSENEKLRVWTEEFDREGS